MLSTGKLQFGLVSISVGDSLGRWQYGSVTILQSWSVPIMEFWSVTILRFWSTASLVDGQLGLWQVWLWHVAEPRGHRGKTVSVGSAGTVRCGMVWCGVVWGWWAKLRDV